MDGYKFAECEWSELLMTDYLTNDTDLTSVANAIRTKGGTSASIEFPSGFVTAIENIPSGGGGTTVTVGITSYDAMHQIAYVDSSGVFHLTTEDVGEGVLTWSDEVAEGSMVVIFIPAGPASPFSVSNLTLSNSLSLGSRASYATAEFYIAG